MSKRYLKFGGEAGELNDDMLKILMDGSNYRRRGEQASLF
jgi:hypothetical protein